MKLLTKAWYRTMQDSGLGVMLRADERVSESSGELFQTLWEEKLADWLKDRQEVCPYLEQVYDEEGEKRFFEERYRLELETFRTRTPGHILEKVTDIRLLALGYCTGEVFQALKEYRDWCRKWTERTLEEAWNMRCSQGLDKVWTGEHSLHDSVVLSLTREGEDLLIEFARDPDATWPEIRGIRFRDAEVLKQEQPVENSWWLYDEIWRTEEGDFEVHALLWRDMDVFELTIGCWETELVWSMPPI